MFQKHKAHLTKLETCFSETIKNSDQQTPSKSTSYQLMKLTTEKHFWHELN